jgi:N-methylhydantoinase A
VIRIGIDIGGTFTDLMIADDRTGLLHSLKTPTTPEDPSIGLITGLTEAGRRFGFGLGDISLLLHGTTIATNAVLERKLPPAVLITTAGFEDVLEIGRHARRDIYGLRPKREPALIARDRRLGLAERMGADGAVRQAPDEAAMTGVLDRVAALAPETVAVALLNANANAAHERAVKARLAAAFPALPVSLSTEISPEIREYERTSTTVLNALLLPVMRAYLSRLTGRLAEHGIGARLLLVQSNGGVCSPEIAAEQPAKLLLSGPSGGALAALRAAEALGRPNLVGIDMGGTSFDVCVVREGAITQMTQGEIDGLPVRLPMVEIRTIGAGGGSIAAVAGGGRLVVGPRSAGARPGPVCYRRGGTEPTVTDANLALGRLDGGAFLGGGMALDAEGARAALAGRVAEPLGLGVDEAAAGILAVTNAALAAAIRLSLFEKGLDPREFGLLSFGGAGGLHAVPVADELGVTEVVFPPDASTFSAYGILESDIVHDLARSRILRAEASSLPAIAEACAALRGQAAELVRQDRLPAGSHRVSLAADMRYHGQAFELLVPWGDVEPDEASLAALLAAFHALHRQRFSYANEQDAVEIVTLRLTVTGALPRGGGRREQGGAEAATRTRRVYVDGAWQEVAVYRRGALDGPIDGPALVEEDYTTAFIAAGWRCAPGPGGALIANRIAA